MSIFLNFATAGERELKYSKAMEIVDEQGEAINDYCLIYLYSKTSGVVPMPIADSARGRKRDPVYYIKWPQKSYSDYEIHKTIEALIIPPVMFWLAEFPVARAILKKGYEPLTWNSYTGREYKRILTLKKGNSEQFYEALISQPTDLSIITDLFSNYAGEWQIKSLKTTHVRYEGNIEIREIFKPIGTKSYFILKSELSDDDRNLLSQCY